MKRILCWLLVIVEMIGLLSGCAGDGNSTFTSGTSDPALQHTTIPQSTESISDQAYSLEPGQSLPDSVCLTGVVTKINRKWDETRDSVTVTILPDGETERTFLCMDLRGDGVEAMAEGDRICVYGMVKNHNGTIMFAAGCEMRERVSVLQRLQEKISGKKLSILGDSISSFEGYSNNLSYNLTIGDNWVWYTGKNMITDVAQTWWMQAIQQTGMQLNVNNSFSSDEVAGRGMNRAVQLHNVKGETPEIIAVYMGINDLLHQISLEDFTTAYEKVISRMQGRYHQADIFLFTLLPTKDPAQNQRPESVEDFNAVIRELAKQHGCTLVDLYADSGIRQDNIAQYACDGSLHPNEQGMDCITACFVDALIRKYVMQ